MMSKILERDMLAQVVRQRRQEGKTLVTTNGSFDLLHAGHVKMLQEAKSLGDVLIVGMNSDLSVTRYKGRNRPICSQVHRAAMLAALACTDYVTIFDELTPIPLLEMVQPDIHVNSPEHGYECVEREVVEKHGGRIHLAQLVGGMSTSQLLTRVADAMSQESRRGIFLTPSVLARVSSEELWQMLMPLSEAGFHMFLLAPDDVPSLSLQAEDSQQQERVLHVLTRPLLDVAQIDRLVEEYDLTLAKSVLISRSMTDIQMGREVNCKTVLLTEGSEGPQPRLFEYLLGPNMTAQSLQEALNTIFRSSGVMEEEKCPK